MSQENQPVPDTGLRVYQSNSERFDADSAIEPKGINLSLRESETSSPKDLDVGLENITGTAQTSSPAPSNGSQSKDTIDENIEQTRNPDASSTNGPPWNPDEYSKPSFTPPAPGEYDQSELVSSLRKVHFVLRFYLLRKAAALSFLASICYFLTPVWFGLSGYDSVQRFADSCISVSQSASFKARIVPEWYYEIIADNQVLRISTRLQDFIGLKAGEWPREMILAYGKYKHDTEAVAEEAQDEYNSLFAQGSRDYQKLFALQKKCFAYTLEATKLRVDFMRRWPNAYEHSDQGHQGHLARARIGLSMARETQRRAKEIYENWLDPNKPVEAWLEQPLAEQNVLGRPVYALSPENYRWLQNKRTIQKQERIDQVQSQTPEDFDQRATNNQCVLNPKWLPPLRDDLVLPIYPSAEVAREYEVPQENLVWISGGVYTIAPRAGS